MKKVIVSAAVAVTACAAVFFLRPAERTIVAELSGGVTMELLPIPAGIFMMGSNDGDSSEKPVHPVTISTPFWMGKTEVTQAQYKQMTGENPSHFQGLENPVESVSWNDAVAFCKKLTEQERQAGRLPEGFAYTLPTEAQWEVACRAGSSTEYYFGDDADRLDEAAWYGENSGGKTHPVAQKLPNAWGLYDMHGNVWEWCSDWYEGGYSSGSVTDPQGPDSGTARVLRGGCYLSLASSCRSAERLRGAPSVTGSVLGFRVCLSAR
ncbi:MAG TPA: formylglycine-generating enzyme family protein [Tichowtungia sp.]|nr:formylglycine-generating enzyme family protein [Tichowtungia sp.]